MGQSTMVMIGFSLFPEKLNKRHHPSIYYFLSRRWGCHTEKRIMLYIGFGWKFQRMIKRNARYLYWNAILTDPVNRASDPEYMTVEFHHPPEPPVMPH